MSLCHAIGFFSSQGSVPVLQSATIENADPSKIILTYDIALNESYVPGTNKYIVSTVFPISCEVSGSTVIINIDPPAVYGDVVVINFYDRDAAGGDAVRSLAGALAASFTSYPVTNNVVLDLSAEGEALYTAMTTKPSNALITAYDTFITGRKTSGVWAKIDKFLFFGTPRTDQSLINWKDPGTLDPELSATPPTFEVYKGYLGVIANNTYINSKYNPVRDGVNASLDSCGFGCYVLNNKTASNTTTMGAGVTAGLSQLDTKVSVTGNKIQYLINDTAASYDIANDDAYGFYHINRSASNAIQIYKNATRTNKGLVSNAEPDNEFLGLARKYNATTDRYSDDQIVAMWFTGDLSELEVLDFRNGLNDLLNFREDRADIAGKTCYYFGDSITLGWDSYDTGDDWVQLLTDETSTTKDNRGISSRSLLNGRTPNFEDNYAAEIPDYNATTDGLIAFSFGVVDLYASTYATEAEFVAVLTAVIDHTINVKGWPKNRILVNGLSWTLTDGTALNTAIKSYVDSEGIVFYNPRLMMADYGGDTLTIDHVHPTDLGYLAYFNGLMRNFKKWFTY